MPPASCLARKKAEGNQKEDAWFPSLHFAPPEISIPSAQKIPYVFLENEFLRKWKSWMCPWHWNVLLGVFGKRAYLLVPLSTLWSGTESLMSTGSLLDGSNVPMAHSSPCLCRRSCFIYIVWPFIAALDLYLLGRSFLQLLCLTGSKFKLG